ncbi:DUF226 domain-containing protein (plasmid) [Borrelia miyamotoi]|uniref:DUF226 domain-containing protein n=2 Tax=Borrelia miyamotoi TaxID=47466 RepID=A0AAQ3CNR3_9SPIR|nr:DUF226 domain-containing protein [Borrelia miyamotoi]AHH05856.1 Putative cytosolic protein [Borrelia miyamotoi FR64b]ATQ15497.1 DUF226 domain-containing protein [Borrelia miyamotoi]ATQ16600.1 DUF226 domain-containing protein [Borrelia miyamotoi]ATQ17773.1 DUF226 domain-containing protein [Borrelia miyamotoi]ATQ18993.1 DUF226 domain-containing protein [Borrelia miyamotoi]
MDSVLERLQEKKAEIREKEKNRNLFIRIEEINNKKIYHTKVMMDFYAFGIDKKKKNKFFIVLRGLFDQTQLEWFSLFSLKDDDKFLGIYYGYRKPIKNVIRRYEENGVMKSSTLSKVYYIEFRFKKGSVFCYIKGISRLLKKEKIDTQYSKFLLELIIDLEKQVYEFYNKKLSEEEIITKWIAKKQK